MTATLISTHQNGRWIVAADDIDRFGVFKGNTPLDTLRRADFRHGFFVLAQAQMYANGAVH